MSWQSLVALFAGLGLMFCLVLAYQCLSRVDWMSPVLSVLTWIMRLRYGLLLTVAPCLLGVIAWSNPHMLEAILLARKEVAFMDCFSIALLSFFTVAVGLSQCRIVELHGNVRFGPIKPIFSSGVVQTDSEKTKIIRWSWRRIAAWWILGSIFPVLVLLKSQGNTTAAPVQGAYLAWFMLAGILTGWIVANLVAVAIAGLESWLLGDIDGTARRGILPYEGIARKFVLSSAGGRGTRVGRVIEWLFGNSERGFSWLLRGPGYTDPKSGILLPGHPQAIILVAFCSTIYLTGYLLGVNYTTWSHITFPTGYCAILILFLIGYFMTIVAFWLDRYGLPPVVFAALYTIFVFYFNVSDHYFEIEVPPAALPREALKEFSGTSNGYAMAASASPANDKSAVNDETSGKVKKPEDQFQQLYWADVLKDWPFPVTNRKKTLVVVTASGGGIQASAWTAKVLTELDREFEGFSQSIGLISSVSGGSVGTMFYLGHRNLLDPKKKDAINLFKDDAARNGVIEPASQSALEAVAWGLVVPDFVRAVIPMAAPPLVDRGWALESLWWNTMGRSRGDRDLMNAVTIRDLIPLVKAHQMPPVIFNATCVETGQRVQISPIHVAVAQPDPENPDDWQPERVLLRNRKKDENPPVELVSKPIDFLDYYDAALSGPLGEAKSTDSFGNPKSWPWGDSNLRVSTAVRLSATFSYVTPVARPRPVQGFGPAATVDRLRGWVYAKMKSWSKEPATDLEHRQRRLNLHYCDGGYADNPGLVTAVQSVHALLDYYRRQKSNAEKEKTSLPFDRILIVRIEPFPKTAVQQAKDNNGYLSAVYGPSAALSAMRVSTQAERGELELRLLEGSRFESRQPTNTYSNAIDLLEIVNSKLPTENPTRSTVDAVLKIASDSAQNVEDKAGELMQGSLIPSEKILDQMINHLSANDLTANVKDNFDSARKQLMGVKEAILNQHPDHNIIPVDSVTFRFEVRGWLRDPSLKDKPEGDQLVEPPLTWTLTEQQKHDIDLAWDWIRSDDKPTYQWSSFYQGTADTISPKDMGRFFTAKKNDSKDETK